MDVITLAAQAAGGVLAALIFGTLIPRLSLGIAGALIVGFVGGACAGLIATSYGLPPAALADGAPGAPAGIAAQMAAGAAGGALLAALTGQLQRMVRR
jgi:hypothetical protein